MFQNITSHSDTDQLIKIHQHELKRSRINESYLNTAVTILSILGGVFGGIPAIIKWISRPRFRIKYFASDFYNTILFTIANEGLLSKDATELEIKCLLQNEDEENRIEEGYSSYDERKFQLAEEYKPKIILIDGLPRGASTDRLFFRLKSEHLPDNFRFFIFLNYREGKTILRRRYPLLRRWLFCWDEVPGNDSIKLIEFLIKDYPKFEWIRTAQIEKSNDNKRIYFNDGKNLICLLLSDDGKSVVLTIKEKTLMVMILIKMLIDTLQR